MPGPSITDIFRQYAPGSLPDVSTAPPITAQDLYDVAAGQTTNSGVNTPNEVQQDLLSLDTFELIEKYGPDVATQLIRDGRVARGLYNQDNTGTRDGHSAFLDTANGVFRGAVNGLGGLASLGLGVVSDDAGAWSAGLLEDFNEWDKGLDSAGLKGRRRATEARGRMDGYDSVAKFKADEAKDGSFLASLKMIGRDAVNAIDNLDGQTGFDVVAEGIGSLAGGGPLIKGGAVASRLGLKALQEGGIISRAARLRAGRIGDKVIPATVIGSLEAGGTYQQTVNEVMGMSEESLMATSADYRELLQTMSPEEARRALANDTGLMAAATTLPAAILGGKLVDKFAANPLKSSNVIQSLSNIGKETLEEAVQGASGQLSTNFAKQQKIDADTNLAEGVGAQIGLGALGGFGAAGTLQSAGAPVVVAQGTLNAGKKLVRAANQQIQRGYDAVQAANAAASPISEEAIVAGYQEAEQELAGVQDTVAGTPEGEIIEKFSSLLRVDPTEELMEGMSEEVQAAVSASTNRVEMMQNLSNIVENGTDEQGMFEAAIMLLENRARIEAALDGETLQKMAELPDSEGTQLAKKFGGALVGLRNNNVVAQRMQAVDAMLAKMAAQQAAAAPVTEAELATPEGETAVKKTITIAEHNPTAGNLDQINTILQHAETGKLALAPEQKAALQTAAKIIETERNMIAEREALGIKEKSDVVSGNILTDRDTGTENKQLSASQHAKGIIAAMKAGETEVAATRLGRFMDFAQHMQNKVEAYNAHFAKGGGKSDTGVKYLALLNGQWRPSMTPAYVNPKSGKSIQFAQRVASEAKAVTEIANQIALAFPELGLQPMEQLDLDPALQRPAEEILSTQQEVEGVVGKTREAKPAAVSQPATPEAKKPTETKPEPKAEPVVEEYPEIDPETDVVYDDETNETEDKPEKTADEITLTAEESKRLRELLAQKPAEPVSEPVEAKEADPAPAEPEVKEEAPVEPETAPEPEPEVVEDLPTTEATPVADTIRNRFPKLIGQREGDKMVNRFLKFFRNKAERNSRVRGISNPIDFIEAEAQYGLDEQNRGRLTAPMTAAYGDIFNTIRNMANRVADQLNTNLSKPNSKKSTISRGEELVRDGALNRFYTGRLLDLIEQNEDGEQVYNQELLESAALAAGQWLLTGMEQRPFRDKNWIEGVLDLNNEAKRSLVTAGEQAKLLAEFGKGMTQIEAINSLGAAIQSYWDVTASSTAPKGIADGVSHAMASEFLEAMVGEGLLSQTRPVLELLGSDRVAKLDNKNLDLLERALPESLADEFPDMIEQLVLQKPEQVIQFGEASQQIDQTQLRNERAELKPEQKAALGVRQGNVFKIDEVAMDFTLGTTLEQSQRMFGAGAIIPEATNNEDLKAKQGKNVSVATSYKAAKSLMKQALNYAKANNLGLGDVEAFYRYTWNRMNRLQMLGSTNPQNSKLLREVILPTTVTADLSDRNGPHFRMFAIAMAQHLGEKIENQRHDVTIEKILGKLEGGKFDQSLGALKTWLQKRDPSKANAVPDTVVDALIADLGGDMSEVAVKSLIEFARYQLATPEQLKSFQTSMYIEADGKTNGPANAIALFTSGDFTTDWLDMMELGGAYFGAVAEHMNDAITKKGGKDDLYIRASSRMNETRNAKRQGLAEKPDLIEQFDVMERFAQLFMSKDISVSENGDVTFERGFSKNPLTITMYGSGAKGIADNIANEILGKIYEQMSNALAAKQANPELSDAEAFFPNDENAEAKFQEFLGGLTQLTNDKPIQTQDDGLRMELATDPVVPFKGDFKKFSLSQKAFDTLSANVLEFMVGPLKTAIEDTLGNEVTDNLRTVQVATNAASQVFAAAFRQERDRRLAERSARDPNFQKNDDLSRDEYVEIFEAVKHLAPVIDNGSQVMMVFHEGKADAGITFASSLSGQFRDRGGVFVPAEAGVLGMPMIVISSADGMMQQRFALSPEGVAQTLDVFDGINVPITTAQEQGKVINRSVFEAWQRNPMTGARKMFESFLKAMDASLSDGTLKLNQDDVRDLARNFMDPQAARKAKLEDVRDAMKVTLDVMAYIDGEITARQAVMARMQMVTDQMAGLEAPHVNEGEGADLSDHAALAQRMNEMLEEERAKQKVEKAKVAVAPEAEQFGIDHETGVKVIEGDNISRLGASLNPSKWQRGLINQTLRIAAKAGYRVVVGDMDQVRAFLASENFDTSKISTDPRSKVKGMAIPEAKLIVLLDPNSETLVHELIHAATLETISAYYAGATGLNSQLVGAIQRLEALANQFMKLEITDETTETMRAFASAKAAMQAAMRDGNKAVALNEFMAWGLSNQKLVKLQSKTEASPLVQLAQKALAFIKRIVFGTDSVGKLGTDMLSNLRFNTDIVLRMPVSTQGEFAKTIAYQSDSYGDSRTVEQINRSLYSQLISHLRETETIEILNADPAGQLANKLRIKAKLDELTKLHEKTLAKLTSAFGLTAQEETTVGLLMTVFSSTAVLDANAVSKAGDMLDHFLKNLSIEMFLDPALANDVVAVNQAEAKFLALTSPAVAARDGMGRTALLPVFMGMAMASEELRQVLSKMALPQSVRDQSGTLDSRLQNLGLDMIDFLGRKVTAQTGRETSVEAVIDVLLDQVAKTTAERQGIIEQGDRRLSGVVARVNEKVVDYMDRGSVWAQEKAADLAANAQSPAARKAAAAAEVAAMFFDRSKEESLKEGALKIFRVDGAPDIMKSVIRDIVGRTDANAPVWDMVKKVKTYVSQARQAYREKLPVELATKFSRPLDKSEWQAMTTALARTDIAALRRKFNTTEINELLQKSVLVDQQISNLEAEIMQMQPTDGQLVIDKAKQLATYMMTGKPGVNLLTNAEAISALLGERASKGYSQAPKQVEAVDVLTSLYAMKQIDTVTRGTMDNLVQYEAEGVSFLVETLRGQKNTEDGKATGIARFNAYKGYYPDEPRAEIAIVVANDRHFEAFRGQSYQRIDDYQNSNIDPDGLESRGVYLSKVKPRAAYSQGVMQTAQQTAGGVDMTTGLTHGRTVAGAIEDAHRVNQIYKNRFRENAGNNLIPRWDTDGTITAYERSVDPAILAPLDSETRLDRIIGIWRGRQEEENNSLIVNKELVSRLLGIWEGEKKQGVSWTDDFVNLLDGKTLQANPLLKQILGVMPAEMYREIVSQFPEGEFWVRKDMLDDALGTREASVRDVWSRNSKWDPKVLRSAEKVAVSVFGNEAYRYAVKAEELIQRVAGEARTIIVVKSVVVPAANMVWNVLQLVTRGVPITAITSTVLKKKDELNDYLKSQEELISLEMEFRAAKGNKNQTQKLYARMEAIKDRQKRLSIWPLIDAGEFSSITEGTLEGDTDLQKGKLLDYIDRAVDKLPVGARTMAKYGMISKDTALFQALQKSVQYGDFLAKAIYYDHLTKTKGIDSGTALPMVSEEFVNYDLQPGRDRGYLEKMGLLWFYHYKLRTVKVGASMIRHNPVQAMLSLAIPFPDIFGTVGSPITDNAVSIIMDGRYHWSMGPEMGFNAPALMPIAQVIS